MYGLAYYRYDPDGYPLYLITKRASGDVTALIYKFNPDTYDMIFAHTLSPPVGKPATGFVSYDIDPYSVYFLCIVYRDLIIDENIPINPVGNDSLICRVE